MAVFKCKMCGGPLEFSQGASICECTYCGTLQTVSKSTDDYIQNLFGRANNFRSKGDFDKAEDTYAKILDRDDTEAEAHWGVVLSRYGIEYVDDPVTGKKIPTCHRTLFEPIAADPDYQAAVRYADGAQRVLYEQEAIYIDKVQKSILEIVKNETPFDVFICYKESDDGVRTQDSVIANDIYYQLTQAGFKVFYAAITLEDKIGAEYEPYIFAALNSAKVMLVLGTKPEYFNAVWVRNEWSRFIKLMKKDRTKQLFPCYRDMDAYDMPDEFSHLQAQDMGKIGFINDLVRGIKKVLSGNGGTETSSASAGIVQQTNSIAPLITRMKNFIDGKEYDKALEYSERILDVDPDNFDANFYAVIAGRKLNKITTTFGKQLNRLFNPESEAHTQNINSENANEVFIDFAYSQVYSVCDFIAAKYPSINKTKYKDSGDGNNVYHSMLPYIIVNVKDKVIVDILLKHGADANSCRTYTNAYGSTQYSALSDAIRIADNTDMVRLLIEHGADANRLERIVDNGGNKAAKSMLTYAIAGPQNLNMVKILLEHGADPNSYRIYSNQYGSTQYSVLGDAIWNVKNIEIARLLLEHGADANRLERIVDNGGNKAAKSMLTYAVVDAKNRDMVRMLYSHGATLENTIAYDGISKVEKKYPYHKNNRTTEAVLTVLREYGWRGDKLF